MAMDNFISRNISNHSTTNMVTTQRTTPAALITTDSIESGSDTLTHSCVPVPFIPECEVLFEGGPDSKMLEERCQKNPGHPTFIPVPNLTMDHLPLEWRSQAHLDFIRMVCDLTVKVIVRHTSPERPDSWPFTNHPYPYSNLKGSQRARRCGTGYINASAIDKPQIKFQPCPCTLCVKSEEPRMEYLELEVKTACHVIYDGFEAAGAVFECFYDSEDREGVKCLYGVSVSNHNDRMVERCNKDRVVVNCVSHDKDLITKLLDMSKLSQSLAKNHTSFWDRKGFIVSHPHGRSKQVTIGNESFYTTPLSDQFYVSETYRFTHRSHLFRKHIKCCIPFHPPNLNCSYSTRSNNNDNILLDTNIPSPSQHVQRWKFWKRECPFLKSDFVMKPGKVYSLPDEMQFTLPPYSEYVCEFRQYDAYENTWLRFHPETIFTLPDGMRIFLPTDTMIKWDHMMFDIANPHSKSFMSYDIDTCPGSSGAPVTFNSWSSPDFHCGSCKDGFNRSVLRTYFGVG